jgi:hypothetical protein
VETPAEGSGENVIKILKNMFVHMKFVVNRYYIRTSINNNLDDNNIEAVFSFYPLAKNLNAKSGSYKMAGKYNKETGVIELKGTEWIDRPSGYDMVDLVAAVDLTAKKINGKIPSRGCGNVVLTKTR